VALSLPAQNAFDGHSQPINLIGGIVEGQRRSYSRLQAKTPQGRLRTVVASCWRLTGM
jgi:hypothetical protein